MKQLAHFFVRHKGHYVHLAFFFIVLTTVLPFYQVRTFDFITMDDPSYVYDNPHVREGITGSGIWWALTSTQYFWLPLTRLSLMAEVSLFGIDPGAMHLVNLFFHVCNVLLFFSLLRRATGCDGASAVATLLFAVHPLRVESVVWIAERKDVLFAFFILLALHAYQTAWCRRTWYRFVPALILFVLANMAKPMAVTLPIMLLLWDYWPLGRFTTTWRHLFWEKIPFFALAILLAGVTIWSAMDADNLPSLRLLSITDRLANIVISYAVYLRQSFWPTGLDFFYEHPKSHWQAIHLLQSLLILSLVTFYAFRQRRQAPFFLFGWLWFLLTLLPVIGFLQNSAQVRADRFTYIPHLGLCVAVTWEARRLWCNRVAGVPILAFLAFCSVAALSWHTWLYAHQWRHTASLVAHSQAVSGINFINQRVLGLFDIQRGAWEEALKPLQRSLALSPHDAISQRSVALVLVRLKRYQEALALLQKSVLENSEDPQIHYLLGTVLLEMNHMDEAEQHFEQAFSYHPAPEYLLDQAGVQLARKGRTQVAARCFQRALAREPDVFRFNFHLGMALAEDPAAALLPLLRAVRLQPHDVSALFNLGKVHNRLKDHSRAAEVLRRALKRHPHDPDILYELAYALLKLGDRPSAIHHLEEALRQKPDFTPAGQLLALARRIAP
ncbi:MAG: tetratricopeptide repeat protein [Magnetococcales bacterium]|nr:tetratricopeptide repeat protein [Magnetococcales bacterium]MBF0322260.1 tetratricopeptide repeat protein [Magnetococcales bacterium]